MRIDFYENLDCKKADYAVIAARYQDNWIFVRQHDSKSWEIPGGHIENNEDADHAAERELKEETGAKDFTLHHICNYSVLNDHVKTYGKLYFAEVSELGELGDHEPAEIKLSKDLPDELTYHGIHPFLFKKVVEKVKIGY